jgi:predicted phosphodiesterase
MKQKIKKIDIFLIIILILLIISILFIYSDIDKIKEKYIQFNLTNNKSDNINKSLEYFSIIVLPDTQKYSESYPHIFLNQTKWIVDNENQLNIKFVIHEGDLVENPKSIKEWKVANKSMFILDKNNISYSVVPGNHDHPAENYNFYFPKSGFLKNIKYKSYEQNNNNFQIIAINKQEYLFISLDFCPSNNEINWADNILKENSNKKIILTTHGYLSSDAKKGVHGCKNTTYIWNNLIKKHKNLQIVLCGHVHSEAYTTDLNSYGKEVHQILADYQERENGGNGYLRIMKFYSLENKVHVQTYSPYLGIYEKDPDSEFSFNYSLSS